MGISTTKAVKRNMQACGLSLCMLCCVVNQPRPPSAIFIHLANENPAKMKVFEIDGKREHTQQSELTGYFDNAEVDNLICTPNCQNPNQKLQIVVLNLERSWKNAPLCDPP
mmetsp:Transcript_66732/g.108244  ORF Transcript_66732/g.108244 Transcript_66732/m.108244 type:complete len:111 (+) Transcript_66732:630-962(+)